MTAEAVVPSRHLAEAIDNAVLFSKEKYPANTCIEIGLIDGEFMATGFTRWSALVDRRPTSSHEGEGSVLVDFTEAEALNKDSIRKIQGFTSKTSVIHVAVDEEGITFHDSESTIGRLERSKDAERYEPTEEHVGAYEHIYDLEGEVAGGELRSMVLLKEILTKLGKVKMSSMEDGKWVTAQDQDRLSFHALLDQVVGVQYGTASILQVTAGTIELAEEEE